MNLIKRTTEEKPVKRMVRRYQPTYYNPFGELLDNFGFDYLLPFKQDSRHKYYTHPNINLVDYGDKYVVEVDVPGYNEENLSISLDGSQLTVSGEYKREENRGEVGKYLIQEKGYSTFTRTLTIPEGSDLDNIAATLDKGILTVTVLKNKGASAPKTITINTKG